MASKDTANNLAPLSALAPAAVRNASADGATIDLAGYESCTFIVQAGTITDGTHTPKLQEAPDDGTGNPGSWTDVAAADQIGAFTAIDSAEVQWVGYIGSQRFARLATTVVAGATGGFYDAVAVRGHPRDRPTA